MEAAVKSEPSTMSVRTWTPTASKAGGRNRCLGVDVGGRREASESSADDNNKGVGVL